MVLLKESIKSIKLIKWYELIISILKGLIFTYLGYKSIECLLPILVQFKNDVALSIPYISLDEVYNSIVSKCINIVPIIIIISIKTLIYTFSILRSMFRLDYDKPANICDVLKSRRIKVTLKMTLILVILSIIKDWFVYSTILYINPNSMSVENKEYATIAFNILCIALEFILIKFIFITYICIQYGSTDLVSSMELSWNIVNGKNFKNIIVLKFLLIAYDLMINKVCLRVFNSHSINGISFITLEPTISLIVAYYVLYYIGVLIKTHLLSYYFYKFDTPEKIKY